MVVTHTGPFASGAEIPLADKFVRVPPGFWTRSGQGVREQGVNKSCEYLLKRPLFRRIRKAYEMEHSVEIRLLRYCLSGDMTGDYTNSVSYASIVFIRDGSDG